MTRVCLDNMSDDRVLEGVEMLASRSNEITAELLAYLLAVEERGLHLREACWSLFAFCVERLHMSEAAAGKRITGVDGAAVSAGARDARRRRDSPHGGQHAGRTPHRRESRRAARTGAAPEQARARQ